MTGQKKKKEPELGHDVRHLERTGKRGGDRKETGKSKN